MKRVWGQVVAGALLACGAAGVSSACVHDNSSLYILNVLASKVQSSAGGVGCGYTNEPTQPFIGAGVLDIAQRLQYDAVFLVGNQLVPQSNPNQLRIETATITIRGAVVRVTDSQGNQLSTFTRLTSATLHPSTGNTPGWTPVESTIVDKSSIVGSPEIQAMVNQGGIPGANAGSVRLVTYTRFFGETLGGQSVESNEFEFPVDVCYGCLIAFVDSTTAPAPDGGGTLAVMVPNCIQQTTQGSSSMTAPVPCRPGQDIPIACNACAANPNCHGYYLTDTP